jgi:hypothetical protein
MTARLAVLPQPSLPWVDSKGRPTQSLISFMTALAAANIGPLVSATNDAAAKTAGVPVNGLYEASGVVRIRLT